MFRKDLRRCVIFGRNDLMQDAPISRVDLLACRNTLMYFDGPTQARILARFHFALNEGGYLFLGRAETMLTHGDLFVPVDLRRRIFTKVRHASERPPLAARAAGGRPVGDAQDLSLRLRSFDSGTTPQFIIDETGRLFLANARARVMFRIAGTDVGRPLQDLEISYRPYELRSVIEQAYAERQPIVRESVAWRGSEGEQRWFDIVVTPLFEAGGAPGGASVSFTDVTRARQLQQLLDDSQVELETAYQELQSTNEELETTNEELHSTVEELETTNEELQSTNEELETMNEELQSTNEELHTINDELRQRSESLNELSTFLESMFTSMRSGIAVLDRDLRVLVWNRQAEELWGVRSVEAEHMSFFGLDIGLPLEQTTQPDPRQPRRHAALLRGAAAGGQPPRPRDRVQDDDLPAHRARQRQAARRDRDDGRAGARRGEGRRRRGEWREWLRWEGARRRRHAREEKTRREGLIGPFSRRPTRSPAPRAAARR